MGILKLGPYIILEDDVVKLRAIKFDDFYDLEKIAFEPSIWQYTIMHVETKQDLKDLILKALNDTLDGKRYVFVVYHKQLKKIIGSTAFGSYSSKDARVEIGWTWYGKEFQKTGINRRGKLLMMQYAFEALKMQRVELKADVLNTFSRDAMKKLGFVEEGILRSHIQMYDGRRRDTIYYSVLAHEWPTIKQNIIEKIH